ncbi:glycosyltransferase [Zobellia alginiliquefaciens]|uniref:glycosyltransferase n=1 Tax=Zobellia alginiliquefaciens TaxID=3032586 RepID=UPI0023E3C93D|nr:glycosyltransferase [Zobellia alginiliquefaciens]
MTKRKNICITINSLGRGGAEKQCLLLAKALKHKHNVVVAILKPEPRYESHVRFIQQEEIEHLVLSPNVLFNAVNFIKFLKKEKIDIVFSFLPTDTIFSAICGKFAGVSYSFGGIRNSYMPKLKFMALKAVNNYLLDYTIANNFAAYSSSQKFGFKKNVFVISNGIDINPFKQRIPQNGACISIISMGRLVEQKQYGVALKSIYKLKETLAGAYRFRYKIVGQGAEEENIREDIRKYGLENEVELVKNPSNIYQLLEESDIYLCSSSFEGVSNSVMEAMNSGLPIVATDAGDNSRLVIHQKNGFISKIGDDKALAGYLEELVQFPQKRIDMGRKSYDHLVEKFSYKAFQNHYLSLIENINTFHIDKGNVQL